MHFAPSAALSGYPIYHLDVLAVKLHCAPHLMHFAPSAALSGYPIYHLDVLAVI